ncbi:hypothetical protein [Gramella sp. KN1008]|uniref:hypothetical protein n=1 Tax=Gramella sp. KN1008 TaxID=2529298 RepID=UPI0010408CE6|nr:hypothetical protein [Gramella sp. KN1008]TBW28266.1 hypothetical protein EZJ28_05835 [Gramella sp. KN1008]
MTLISNNIKEINLEYTPHSKALLEIFVMASDESLIVKNKYLKSELIRLSQTSNLVDLILTEYMTSSDYKGQNEVSLEDVDLNYTPHTKYLIKQYLINQYEGEIELSNETLKEFLLRLHRNDDIDSLILSEWIYSPGSIEFEPKLESELPDEELRSLKNQLREKLQILNKFLSLQEYCIMTNQMEFRKSCKKYQYLNLEENKHQFSFSDEPLTLISVATSGNLKKTFWNLTDKIECLENHLSELINQILKKDGIELPPDFRFTTNLD